jgi:hypothetical protein
MNTLGEDYPAEDSDQSFRTMLDRATDDPDTTLAARVQQRIQEGVHTPTLSTTNASSPSKLIARESRPNRSQRVIAFGAAALISAASLVGGAATFLSRPERNIVVATPPTQATQPTQAIQALDLDLTRLRPEPRVVPSRGPALDLVVTNRGGVQQTKLGQGWTFLRGGQQRKDTAYLTVTGPNAAGLFKPNGGRLSITFTSQRSLEAREVKTGRNTRMYVQLTSDDTASQRGDPLPSDLVRLSLSIDPEIGPYLTIGVAGVSTTHALTAAQQRAFDSGKRVVLDVVWASGSATTRLNGVTVATLNFDADLVEPAALATRARLSIGASADFGGGYFSVLDDRLEKIEIESATESGPQQR